MGRETKPTPNPMSNYKTEHVQADMLYHAISDVHPMAPANFMMLLKFTGSIVFPSTTPSQYNFLLMLTDCTGPPAGPMDLPPVDPVNTFSSTTSLSTDNLGTLSQFNSLPTPANFTTTMNFVFNTSMDDGAAGTGEDQENDLGDEAFPSLVEFYGPGQLLILGANRP